MPSKNTDAQNNWLYATNILLQETGFRGYVGQRLLSVRSELFDEDGNWYLTTDDVSNDESRITPVDELAPWERELLIRDHEDHIWPNRVELDDIAFTYSSAFNWVITTDGVAHSDNNWSQPACDSRENAEKRLWPNRVALDDILMSSTWTTQSPSGASFVWFKENGKYYTGHAFNVSHSFVKNDEDWLDIRNNWEEFYWPERIQQDDINFTGMITNKRGANESVVFTTQGNWWATGTHISSTWPSRSTRDASENYRWPNRVSEDKILGWRTKNHQHLYIASNNSADYHEFGSNVSIYCHVTDKEF